jgi:hypothetical protein
METDEAIAAYIRLSMDKQIQVLADYAYRVSEVARSHYIPRGDAFSDARELWELNEVQHRVIEQLLKLLASDERRRPDEVFVRSAVGCSRLNEEFRAALKPHFKQLPGVVRYYPNTREESGRIFQLAWSAFEHHPIYPKLLSSISRRGMIRSWPAQHEWNWIMTVMRPAARSSTDIIARVWVDGADNCEVRVEPGWENGTPPDCVSGQI